MKRNSRRTRQWKLITATIVMVALLAMMSGCPDGSLLDLVDKPSGDGAGSGPTGPTVPSGPWAQSVITGSGDSRFVSVAVDSAGNAYAVGSIRGNGTYSFGPAATVAGSHSETNALLVKYDGAGNAQWARSVVTGLQASKFNSVSLDSDGNVYVAGFLWGNGTYTFDSGVSATGASTGRNAVLVKYDNAGNALWARSIAVGSDHSNFLAVSVGTDGKVHAAGIITGTGSYTFGPGITVAGVAGSSNLVLVQYDTDGTALWANSVTTGSDSSVFRAAAVDSGGNVLAVGTIRGDSTYTLGPNVTATGSYYLETNALVAKYNAAGTALWAHSVTGATDMSGFYSVSTDTTGNVFSSGMIGGTATYSFGGEVAVEGSGGIMNAILVKYNSAGAALWARTTITGIAESRFDSVAFSEEGSVFAAGHVYSGSTYTFGPDVTVQPTADWASSVLVQYDSNGTAQSARTVITDGAVAEFHGVAIDGDGGVYAAGYIRGTESYFFCDGATAAGSHTGDNAVLVKYIE